MEDSSKKLVPESVVAVDDDETILNLIRQICQDAGVTHFRGFQDGIKAWEFLAKTPVDFLILDWRVPEVSGAALFNRVRALTTFTQTPILVVSGYLHAKDASLLEELPFAGLIEKPFSEAFLARKIRVLYQDWQWYKAEKTNIAHALDSLESSDTKVLEGIVYLMERAPRPVPFGIYAARQFVARGHKTEAEVVLRHILRSNPDSLPVLTELGKLLLQTKRVKEASALLSKAQGISPQNLDRLCMLGDASMQLLDPEKAGGYFKEALEIDPESPRAQAGMTLADNLEKYLSQANVTSIPSSFASLLNAIGISVVRGGKFEEGMKHYRSAMVYVGEDAIKGKIAYNLGLGYLRWKKPQDAMSWFREAIKLSGGTHEKAQGYVERLANHKVEENKDAVTDMSMTWNDEAFGEDATFESALGFGDDERLFVEPHQEFAKPDAPPEKQGPADDPIFESLRSLIANLKTPDTSVFGPTGQNDKKDRYDAYPLQLNGTRCVIFIPRIVSLKSAATMNVQEATAVQIFAMQNIDGKWQRLWPKVISKVA
jgi:DNA-binding response OmpR family regulator